MKDLLIAAKREIEILRRENEVLRAKVSVMDLFATVLHTHPSSQCVAMGVDVAWELGNQIFNIEAEESKRADVKIAEARHPSARRRKVVDKMVIGTIDHD